MTTVLPDRLGPPIPYRPHQYPVVGIEIGPGSILTSDGAEVPIGIAMLAWLVERYAYCSVKRATFDALLRFLPPSQLTALATDKQCAYLGFTIRLFGTSEEAQLLVAVGRKRGYLCNVPRLVPDGSSAVEIKGIVSRATGMLRGAGFDVAVRTIGQTIQDITLSEIVYQRPIPNTVVGPFAQSFRAARMEGVRFGTSAMVYDYDIVSAYPWMVAQLPTTNGIRWQESTSIPDDADYAAALCDVAIKPTDRGPLAVRDQRTGAVFYPVGNLSGVWLNKPELDLLGRFPHLGRVEHVHRAVSGTSPGGHPFSRLVKRLFKLRNDPELSGYFKGLLVAQWGKFLASYQYRGGLRGSPMWNPVYAGHVTAAIRCEVYRRCMVSDVVGEFIDGFSSTAPVDHDARRALGGLALKGSGAMTLFTDQFKAAEWKNPELRDAAMACRDKPDLWLPEQTLRHTLASAVTLYGEDAGPRIGEGYAYHPHYRLGSAIREMIGGYRVGDYLDGAVESRPIRQSEIRGLLMMQGAR